MSAPSHVAIAIEDLGYGNVSIIDVCSTLEVAKQHVAKKRGADPETVEWEDAYGTGQVFETYIGSSPLLRVVWLPVRDTP